MQTLTVMTTTICVAIYLGLREGEIIYASHIFIV